MSTQELTTQDRELRTSMATVPAARSVAAQASPSARPRALGHLPCGGDLTVGLHRIDGVLVVVPYGSIGPASRVGLYAALNAAFASRPVRMVINASFITLCDIRGLAAFIDAAERASDSAIPLAMSGLAPPHLKLLRRSWRDTATEALSHSTVEHALAAVQGQLTATDHTRQELLDDLQHLQGALNDNQNIEQAKGILMATYGLDADAALDALRWHSRALDIKLRVLATALISVVRHSPVGTAPSVGIDVFLAELAPVRQRSG